MIRAMALREARKRRRLTQDALAALSGVEQATISRIEAGLAQPTWETAWRLSRALGVRPEVAFPIQEDGQ